MKTKMKNALLFGITGQDGPYLAQILLRKKYKVFGVARHTRTDRLKNLRILGIEKKVRLIQGDIVNKSTVERLIKKIKPDEIYSLAAQSHVKSAWENPQKTFHINTDATINILEAIRVYSSKSKLFYASSSEIFGKEESLKPINEDSSINPSNPYGISKAASHFLVKSYRESYGLFCVNGILFNHESPLRSENFVTRKITAGVAKIYLGFADSLELGNLSIKRDWGYASDYMEAAYRMLQQKKPQDFVIASGEVHSLSDLLEIAFTYAGLKNWKKYVRVNKAFFRPSDNFCLHGDSRKAMDILKWKPTKRFDMMIKDMVEFDIKNIKKKYK